MATVLFAWESGSGQGHVMQMRPLAEGLVRRGHTVYVALRHLSTAAADIFGSIGVRFRQAPFKSDGPRPTRRTDNFADVLAGTGWGDARELFILAYGWRGLIEDVAPDAVVADYSPTALLAIRGLARPVKRVVIGSGFCIPPDESPLPPLIADPPPDVEALCRREGKVLARTNHVLTHWGKPPLARLGQLFSGVDGTFLTTFKELEQYASRVEAEYWGPVLPRRRRGARMAAGRRAALLRLPQADGPTRPARRRAGGVALPHPTLRRRGERSRAAADGRSLPARDEQAR